MAERLDLEPAMVMGRLVAARPASGGEAVPAVARNGAAQAQPPAPRMTSRERRERALLAMCIALSVEGRGYIARLTEDLSPRSAPEQPPGCASIPRTRPPTCPGTTTNWPA